MIDNNVFQLFAAAAGADAEKAAISSGTGDACSYGELLEQSGRIAARLRARGVTPGDRVVVQIEKAPFGVALYLATLQVGAVFVPLNIAYTDAEIDYFLADAEPALFIHEAGRAALWRRSIAVADLAGEATEATPDLAIAARSDRDLAALCYTSGTTGRSKGAMITHGNLASNACALIELWRFTPADTLLHILPIFHVHGLFVAIHCALFSGATMLFERGFDVGRTRALLPRATVMMGVPTHYMRLLADPDFNAEEARGMRLFVSGSAPLLADGHRAFAERSGHAILERYGMTEAGMITSNPYEGERLAGTVGYPLPGVEARVRMAEGASAEADGIGTLEIRGPNVFAGYWRMDEKTRESFTDDGWFITGDLVTQAADGRVTIVGRAKDLIIAGGYNIYPKEIEAVLDEMPGVEESAVFGVPHAEFGESVVAVLVPCGGVALDDAAVDDWLRQRLARFKHPRQVHVLDSLPRNAMGKVQKAELRRRYTPPA